MTVVISPRVAVLVAIESGCGSGSSLNAEVDGRDDEDVYDNVQGGLHQSKPSGLRDGHNGGADGWTMAHRVQRL